MYFCYFCLFPFPLYPRAVVTSVDNLLDRSRFPLLAALGMLLPSPEAAQHCPSALQLLQGHSQLQSLGAFLCHHQTHREKKAAEMGVIAWPASAPCSRDRSPGTRFIMPALCRSATAAWQHTAAGRGLGSEHGGAQSTLAPARQCRGEGCTQPQIVSWAW